MSCSASLRKCVYLLELTPATLAPESKQQGRLPVSTKCPSPNKPLSGLLSMAFLGLRSSSPHRPVTRNKFHLLGSLITSARRTQLSITTQRTTLLAPTDTSVMRAAAPPLDS